MGAGHAPRRTCAAGPRARTCSSSVGSSTGGTAAYQAHGRPGLALLITGWPGFAALAAITAQKSSGTPTPVPPVTATAPNCGNVTVPAATDTVNARTSSGTSNTTAAGNVSPP
ncbi:hypothetical protein FHX81_3436 [Saccharothrix saharensis]|uniref:Uncharacterized protein n=1 Tax=Saccharothrix saharensis TaxID=571190 RepID=A0A543JDZ5_9PSEU|nr:hypothetical protein FHX81_3436 [Saccharothrix saharensis]